MCVYTVYRTLTDANVVGSSTSVLTTFRGAVVVPILVVDLFVMSLQMLLQVGRVLAFQHRRTVAAPATRAAATHFAYTHVGIGEVLEVFPDGAAAPSAQVLRVPALKHRQAAAAAGVRRNTQSVDLGVEALDVLLEVRRVLSLQHSAARTDVRVDSTDALVDVGNVVEERPNRTRSRPTWQHNTTIHYY